ncbi:MAG: hypothetical protein HOV80_15195 [Polyangiaceae bacterium]|nr:hypothetical protein [Polyangiaceae bacterium]
MRFVTLGLVAIALAATASCGDDEDGEEKLCETDTEVGCVSGQVCEEVEGGDPACFDPVVVDGRVFDLVTTQGVADARVVARDENQAAVSPIAKTDVNGAYRLTVPSKRDAKGNPVSRLVTLRADASGYQSFPTPPRVALPVDVKDAAGEKERILKTPTTDIGLVALADTSGLGTVSGTVETEVPMGTLVVIAGATGVADRDGTFVVFNVPAGSQTAGGYKQGINLSTAPATVTAGQETIGIVLSETGEATATVSGSVQIVNASGGMSTSVILVLEDTFDPTLIRGETPPGLRAGNVSGAFSISGVPDGKYAVLAAFENDGLVRDPDTSIGGTEVVHITVAGSSVTAGEGFKVTGALAVVSPGANDVEKVSGTPTFVWEDDSSEDEYHVTVYDALGTLVWETTGNFDPGGSSPAEVTYGGPALTSGMIYQFRATSIKDGTPISSTEDLKGVFVFQ